MKNFAEYLTSEQKAGLTNWYVWHDNGVYKVIDSESSTLTPENFRLLYIRKGYFGFEIKVLTVEDIKFCQPEGMDFDFKMKGTDNFFYRDEAPKKVVEFLDNYLNIAQYGDFE